MEMQEAYMGTSGGMLNWGNSAVKGVKLYGDVRFRYQWESSKRATSERQQLRYRVRLGADYQFTDNFRAGVRASTAASETSTNVTLAGFGGGGIGNNDQLKMDLWYLIYENDDMFGSGLVDNVQFGLGKFKQPFMIDKAFWDGDINPEGFYQSVGWDDLFVDGLDVQFTAGQFVTNGAELEGAATTQNGSMDFLFAQEVKFKYSNFTVAPSFWISTEHAQNQASFDNGGTNFNSFAAIMIPASYKFKAFGYSHGLKATYGVNVAESEANQLFQFGYKLGSAKKKGTWEIGADFRYIENQAWDANITDSDFHDRTANGNGAYGYKLGAKYAVTDNIIVGGSYYHSFDINNQSSAATVAEEQLAQFDINWKF
ncbi:MAG: putative porin [Verrucomicrobiota bacterium]